MAGIHFLAIFYFLVTKMNALLKQIATYLREPYPYYYKNGKKLFFLLLFIAVLSFLFSYFFEPFEVNVAEHKIHSLWILVIHAFTPLPIAFVYLRMVNVKKDENAIWTLGKELRHLSIILLLIGFWSFLVRDFIYTNPDNWSLRYLWEEIRNTFLVGFLLLMLILPFNLERLIKRHNKALKKIQFKTPGRELRKGLITIQGNTLEEDVELRMEDFLFAKVEGNYTEIFSFSSQRLHKTLVRVPLKVLEEQLQTYGDVYRTHRSYLVNLNAIVTISGNAQGYLLTLKNCSLLVPVSRSKINDFNATYTRG
ncbi:LytR/AlgR family response regulator transcription factor [Spongiimicrobium salis]|uniref:LytR/AlgR family response regulator transcription factor n=1 Tax=Spongiimicrobium salis TaxID=1667022 RepID=UPI00374CBECB